VQDGLELSPLLQYDLLPVYIAIGVLLLLAFWFGLVFWLTRKIEPKVLATAPPAPIIVKDLVGLKESYLQKINEIETQYRSRKIKARTLHQELSLLLRSFVSEAEGMPVKTMTLSDLKKTKHHKLTPVIESYYLPEFAAVETGKVDDAIVLARKVVQEWA
jgi:uncharacterized protein YneF (UPF0154 family)